MALDKEHGKDSHILAISLNSTKVNIRYILTSIL